jgi:hypothetical protein
MTAPDFTSMRTAIIIKKAPTILGSSALSSPNLNKRILLNSTTLTTTRKNFYINLLGTNEI